MNQSKKWIIILSAISLLSLGAITTISVFFTRHKVLKINSNQENTNLNFTRQKLIQQYDNIIDYQDKADINVYFTPYGIQPFYNFVRLAMLSKNEAHFLYTKNVVFQENLNKDSFEEFLKTKRLNNTNLNDEKNEENHKNSRVIDLGTQFESSAYNYISSIIKNNPNKNIFVWLNSDFFKNDIRFAELSQNPNVVVNAIEDSNILGTMIAEEWIPQIKETYFINNKWDYNSKIYDRYTQYLLGQKLDNIQLFFSSHKVVEDLKNNQIHNVLPFFSSDINKEIKDVLFSSRDKNRKRLSVEHYPKITGLNWEKERDKVQKIEAINNKKSLIIMGSVSEEDYQFVINVAKKYGKQYNIFYKGHPGHNIVNKWIEDELSQHKEVSYSDFVDNSSKKFILPDDVYVVPLESQIPSEELTTNHALEDNGLFFDKWILTDSTSGAVNGIINGKNIPNDIIASRDAKTHQMIFSGTAEYKELISTILGNIASKFLTIKKINEKNDKDINNYQINISPNSYLIVDLSKTKIDTNENNDIIFLITVKSTIDNSQYLIKTTNKK
ncbi:hypothetical protein [[Mycoplasma] gypis]|uniref:Uncharacterized protein n=1 Tax=[Mycoplasma] gypis TaxID=92404 RepID=A0ABZ2RMW0_9BACT|nr:hypothetical protein [[Mycoplasma] gypis]MBN0919513.1 hypothetical protein [[Mycoplasma] gypis]